MGRPVGPECHQGAGALRPAGLTLGRRPRGGGVPRRCRRQARAFRWRGRPRCWRLAGSSDGYRWDARWVLSCCAPHGPEHARDGHPLKPHSRNGRLPVAVRLTTRRLRHRSVRTKCCGARFGRDGRGVTARETPGSVGMSLHPGNGQSAARAPALANSGTQRESRRVKALKAA